MKTSNWIWLEVVLVVVIGGWYYLSMMPSANMGINGSVNQNNMGTPSVAGTLGVATSPTLGNYLVASNGMTLYLYTKDTPNVSNCYDDCAVKWPPYSPEGSVSTVVGNGVTGAISTITRKDSTTQLTYNGIPLYYWYLDKVPGDTTGQNVGGVWFVVKP